MFWKKKKRVIKEEEIFDPMESYGESLQKAKAAVADPDAPENIWRNKERPSIIIEERPSVILEEEEIFDPMAGYGESLQEEKAAAADDADWAEVREDGPSPQYISEETDDEAPIRQASPEEEPAGDDGVEVIAEGAMCKCSMGKSPGKMNVVCQFKVYCNGGRKLVAGNSERNILSLSFGSCTAKNNAPCMPDISWQNCYEDVQIVNSTGILTMESKGICSAGGGQIEFQTSGQSRSVSAKGVSGVERESLKSDNPLLRAEEEPGEIPYSPEYEKILRETEEKIRQQAENLEVILEDVTEAVRGKVDKNAGIVPVTYPVSKNNGTVKQPKGVLCSFLAAKKGILSWKVRDDKMKIIREADGAGTISVSFPKYGRYVIEAFGTSSTVKDDTRTGDIEKNPVKYFNTLIVDVVPDEIILEADKQKWYVGGKVEVKAKKLFADRSDGIQGLKYRAAQNGIAVGTDKAEITAASGGCTVTFREKGGYVVTAGRVGDTEVKPTGGITIENILVVSVTANGKSDLKTRPGETIEVDAELNFKDGDKSKIKWDFISPDGERINKGRPQPGDFRKPGDYRIYAYCGNARSEKVKATVGINDPKFLNINWKDGNNKPVTLIGAREKIYARVLFEYAAGSEIRSELRTCDTDETIQKYTPVRMKGNDLVVPVGPLPENVCRNLKDKRKLYLYLETGNAGAVKNKNAAPKSYPVCYSTGKDITGLDFYGDAACKNPVSTAAYGSIIYAKVVTRNLKQEKIQLKLVHEIDWKPDETLGTFDTTLNDDGTGVFGIKVKDGWAVKNGKWQKTVKYVAVISEVGSNAYKEELTLGRDAASITFTDKPKDSEKGEAVTVVRKVNLNMSKDRCPRCRVFTEAHFKEIFPGVTSLFPNGTNQLKSTTIKAFADELNKAFDEFGVDNCNRKLHFLTQTAYETGNFARIDENLNYNGTKFRNANWPKDKHPKLYENDAEKKFSNNPEALADYVYRNHDGNGDEASGDGYKYRGRGLIQITKKGAYQRFENYLKQKDGTAEGTIVNNPDLLLNDLSYMVRSAVWFWKYGKTNTGTDARLDMSLLADKGNIKEITRLVHGSTNTIDERISKYETLKKGFNLSQCTFYMNNLVTNNIIEYHIYENGDIKRIVPSNYNSVKKTKDEPFNFVYYYHDNAGTKYYINTFAAFRHDKRRPRDTVIEKNGRILVNMPVDFEKTIGTKLIKYKTDDTPRNYADPDAFAAFLGALAECSYTDFQFRGFTCKDGIGKPSVSHYNGYNFDMAYLRRDKDFSGLHINNEKDWNELDLDRQNNFHFALIHFGYSDFKVLSNHTSKFQVICSYTGKKVNINNLENHHHHLHVQGFDTDKVTEEIRK
ncbi:MAG: DUF4280 domain-containing protein [Candidatus Azobacteroides sp.]|nr:DUF4280 domain-containing protein [Candidatus Azobacteroides sp.]